MKQDESGGLLVSRNDPALRSNCRLSGNECTTALVKQKELDEPEPVGSHWSGQPGKDLFFNSWKLLF